MSEENNLDGIVSTNFIDEFVKEDIGPGGRCEGMRVHTRFPPEPNGYLHIGHAKAIYIDFGTAERFGGVCNLRMDDTNPAKEDVEYVDAIKEDIRWLGYDWEDRFYFASDYFEQMYEAAVKLIEELGGEVVKVVFLMELAGLKGRERLKDYDVESVICYEGK